MKKFDRDLVQETIENMGLTVRFDSDFAGFRDVEGDLLYLSEIADVLQLIDGYDEPYDFPTEEGD